MARYSKNVKETDYNLSIDGIDIIVEEYTPNESFNRRETSRKAIIGGTQQVIRTNYLPRDYSVTTHFIIDPSYPDVYNKMFREWQSKPVEVISRLMGGKFNAECIVKTTQDSPNYLKVEIQLVEIPEKSLIPNDELQIPTDKINDVTISSVANPDKDNSRNAKSTPNKSNPNNAKKNNPNRKGNTITRTR